MSELPSSSYPSVIPYLLARDAAMLIAFLEQGLGAATRFLASTQTGEVKHAELTLGDGVLMVADAPQTVIAHICHYVPDVDEAFARAMEAGAKMLSPPETKHYGQRVAGIEDPAGNIWWLCGLLQ